MSEVVPRRPLLLTIGAIGLTVVSALWVVFFGAAAFGFGAGELDGRPVAPEEFFARAGAKLLSLGILGLVLAFGFWWQRAWARPLSIVACVVVPIVLTLTDQESRRALGLATLCGVATAAVVALCLYAVPPVRAYYARLGAIRDRDPGPNDR